MEIYLALGLLIFSVSMPANSALNNGDNAPNFVSQASLGGKVFRYSLADALKKGPVVLYFYPAAFTPGCTIEAHDFADAIEQYQALGASVIGVSNDDIEKLNKFSVSECRSKFPVAADSNQTIMRSYDAIFSANPKYSDRISYVISPDGKIVYNYTDMQPDKHVVNSLEALRKWKQNLKTY